MRVLVLSILCCFFLSNNSFAQSALSDILQSGEKFSKIVTQADRYFTDKHPGLTAKDLTTGEYRDGEYVKFKRW